MQEKINFLLLFESKTPTRETFTNFLNKSGNEIVHRVFVATPELLNEMKVLSIYSVFIDETDILIRKYHYFIKQRDLKAMDLLNEWNLIHDGSSEKELKIKRMKKIKKWLN